MGKNKSIAWAAHERSSSSSGSVSLADLDGSRSNSIFQFMVAEKAYQQILYCHGFLISQLERLAVFDIVRVPLVAEVPHLASYKLSFLKMHFAAARWMQLAKQIADVLRIQDVESLIYLEVKERALPVHARESVS